MRIYSGEVTGYGSGNVAGNGTSSFVLREYLDIGGKHLRRVRLHQYLDDTLVVAGQKSEPISISTFGLIGFPVTAVAAVKLANGSVRRAESVLMVPLFFLAYLFLGLLVGGGVAIVLAILTDLEVFALSGNTIFLLGLVLGVLHGTYGFVDYVRARYAF